MNEPDQRMQRLFAQAPAVGADEGFVLQVATQVAARRGASRARRIAWAALLGVAGVALALLLAPLAPTMVMPGFGESLLAVPAQLGDAAATVPGAPWLGLTLAAVVLPLAGVAWLLRRA